VVEVKSEETKKSMKHKAETGGWETESAEAAGMS